MERVWRQKEQRRENFKRPDQQRGGLTYPSVEAGRRGQEDAATAVQAVGEQASGNARSGAGRCRTGKEGERTEERQVSQVWTCWTSQVIGR